jgi:ABC-type Na+ transport system ATPase subunit NatA
MMGRGEGSPVAEIEIDNVSKVFPDGTRAVSSLSLDIGNGDFCVLVGPSGCGKTTGLRMVAGLEDVTEGTIRIGERVVNDLPAKDRDVAMEQGARAGASAFVARLSPRAGARDGGDLELFVDTRSLHFFDPASGLAIYDRSA